MRPAAPDAPLRRRVAALAGVLLRRPSLWLALALAVCVQLQPGLLWPATLCLPLCWLCERSLRQWLRLRLASLMARPLPQP